MKQFVNLGWGNTLHGDNFHQPTWCERRALSIAHDVKKQEIEALGAILRVASALAPRLHWAGAEVSS